MKKNLSPTAIKKAVPKNYELASEDKKMLIFEKSVGSRIYDIKVLYNDNVISSVIFSTHPNKVWSLLGEIDDLGYKSSNQGFKRNGIETEAYENSDKSFAIVWVENSVKRTLTGFINRK